VRTTDQLCGDCHAAGVTPTDQSPAGTGGWRTVQAWQDEAGDDDEHDDEHDANTTERQDKARVATARAAEALASTEVRLRAAAHVAAGAERNEQLARWHADDEAARLTAERADSHQTEWDERGVA
jgi:hypothetical protein